MFDISVILNFIKENKIFMIIYLVQAVVILLVSIAFIVRNRRIKLLEITEKAIEEAEKLDGTGEQRKTYAMALIKQKLNVSDKKISNVLENFISFSKLVNAKSNKTIEEVIENGFTQSN